MNASRQRRAALRAAVMRAHPDHGGTSEELRVALASMRAGGDPWGRQPLTEAGKPALGTLPTLHALVLWVVWVWAGAILASAAILAPIWLIGVLLP